MRSCGSRDLNGKSYEGNEKEKNNRKFVNIAINNFSVF